MTAEVGLSTDEPVGVEVFPGDGVLERELLLTPPLKLMLSPNGAPAGVGAVRRLMIHVQSQLPAKKTGPNNIVRMI